MSYFLVVYNRTSGAVEVTEYAEDQGDRAFDDRFARELADRDHPEVEVALLAAPSLDALKNTHARYFKTVSELAASARAVVER